VAFQPYLHEVVTCVRAPSTVLSGRDGQIRAGGAHGLLHAETRFLSELVATIDGREPAPIGHHLVDGGTVRFVAAVVGVGDDIADPTVRLVRERTVDAGRLRERLTVVNDSRRPVRVELTIRAAVDMAPIGAVKAGRAEPTVAADTATRTLVRWTAGPLRTELRPAASPAGTDPAVTVTGGDVTLTWALAVASRSTAVVELDVTAGDAGPAGWFPAAPLPAWAGTLTVRSADPDLGPLVDRSIDDVVALLLADGEATTDTFVAAGSPWYLTLFGRDSLWTARFLLPLTTDVAAGTLRTLARRQASSEDPVTGAEPGKILHEVRRARGAGTGRGLPPVYYGTVDATPLWVSLLHDAWCWGLPDAEVAPLLDPLEAALGWIVGHGDRFLSYRDESGQGLANQGWKDSGDAIQDAQGEIATPPITLCEVQGYAHRAALDGARVLDAFGRPGAADARRYAVGLTESFRGSFWVEGPDGLFPAVALDGAGRPVDSLTSNIGHLLASGLLDDAERDRVAHLLAGPGLAGGYGLRTLDSRHASFNPIGYHTGSVWPHDTAIAIDGLVHAGCGSDAVALTRGLLGAARRFDYRLPELFGGSDAADGPPLAYPAACHPQAWAAASVLVLLRAILGLAADVPAGVLTVRPDPAFGALFPLEVDGLRVAGHRVDVAVDAGGRADVVTDAPLRVLVN
jgi:glycogen debranching enzyme